MLKQAFSLFLLLAFLSCLQGAYSDYVLCLDINGHMEVEVSQNGHCGSNFHVVSKITSLPFSTIDCENGCGPCVDIPYNLLHSSLPSKAKSLSVASTLILDIVTPKFPFSMLAKKCFFACYFRNFLSNNLQTAILRI